jgi:glycosyltransferase involved in cell wall biosynthesis
MSAQQPVTILIHSSDHGDALLACVESALAQTAADVRVLVLDDGSSDGSLARVAQIEDSRLVVVPQSRCGGGALITRGVALAGSGWILLVRGAALLDASCVERALRLAGAEGGLDAIFVLPGPAAVARTREPAASAGPLSWSERVDLLGDLLVDDPLAGAAALVHHRALAAIGGVDPTLRVAWALALWIDLLRHGRVCVLPGGLVRPAATRAGETAEELVAASETSFVRMRALGSFDEASSWMRAGADPDPAPARVPLELAVRGLAHGESALVPFALELARRALASAGPTAERLPVAITSRLPGLEAAAAPRPTRVAARAIVDETPLRVALEVSSLGRGGLERVVADLALGLRGRGVEPAVVCTRSGGPEAERLADAGIEVRLLDADEPAADLSAWLERRGIGVLHSHFSSFGTQVAAQLGLPVLSTLHNAYAWVGAGFEDEVRAVDPLVSRYTATSESVADFSARRFQIERARIRVIRNAVPFDHHGAEPDRTAARAALGVVAGTELVVQVARVHPVKCQLALVDAVAALAAARPRLHAWLVGPEGDASYAERTRERIARAGLSGRVALLGERDDVRLLLAAADVFALPSLLEGLSLAAIEALHAGLPLVLTRTGDAAFLLGEGAAEPLGGELIDPPPVDPFEIDGATLAALASVPDPTQGRAVAGALARVLDDLPRRRAAAAARREALAAALSPERMVTEYAQLLRRTAALARRGRRLLASARRDALAAELEAARRETEVARRAALREARAVAVATAAGRALRDAEWNLEHVAGELGVTRAALERGEYAQASALEKLRLKHRAQTAVQRLGRWATALRAGRDRRPPS